MQIQVRARAVAAVCLAAVLVAGCGGEDASDSDDVAGVDEAGEQQDDEGAADDAEESDEESEDAVERPDINLPDDVINEFEPVDTDDAVEKAVLADSERYINSVDEAVNQEDTDGAMAFYTIGDALDANVNYVGGMREENKTFAGTTRYYHREVEVLDDGLAEVSYCADASDSYVINNETGEETADSGLTAYYTVTMQLSDEHVWQASSFSMDRGLDTCA